jgi:hypothetical protein
MASEEFLQSTYTARDSFAKTLGVSDADFLAPLINPSFMGGPMWPDLRQAWRVIRTAKSTIVLSDGLSDPFSDDEAENVGFGVEIVAESCDQMPPQMQSNWLFDLVYHVSQQCAGHGGVHDLIEQFGLLSLELPMCDSLLAVATNNDTAGVLLGMESPSIPSQVYLPGGSVRIITAKLLWPTELEYAATNGKAGREELVRRFVASGECHKSSLSRKPVV